MSQARRLSAIESRLAGPGRTPARSAEGANPDTDALDAERSLYAFVRQAWPHVESATFVPNWHIEMICDHLQAITRGDIENLLINIPPGHSKSLIVSVFWPGWEWVTNPAIRWFFASYDQRLSTRDSVKCRALIASRWFQERWGDRFALANDQNQKTYYETVAGGYRLATSVCGHGMGEHPDRIVIDDPHDPKGAESEAERLSVLEWWDLTMSTRGVSRGVKRVIIMQRLAENDLAGHVLTEGGFVHVCLPLRFERGRMAPSPARDSDDRPWTDRRSEEGELLAPDQFPEKAVEAMERRLGSYGVAGQLQQRPAPRGGALFKRMWFENRRRYELQNGETILRQGKPVPLPLSNCCIFVIVDGGASSKVTSDPTVISVFACAPDGDLFVLWVVRARLEVEEIVPVLDDVCRALDSGLARWASRLTVFKSGSRKRPEINHGSPASAPSANLSRRGRAKQRGRRRPSSVPSRGRSACPTPERHEKPVGRPVRGGNVRL